MHHVMTKFRRALAEEDGMTTAEYAVGTVAACAFAAVLLKVVSSQDVLALLTAVVTRALHTV
jgi:Flp pilus assembly pilin Flp